MDHRAQDYLIWSIINTAFFGVIFGVIALFFSLKTRDANEVNEYETAKAHSKLAFVFNIIGTLFGISIYIIFIVLFSMFIGLSR
jgi:hypothetical protein